MAPAELADLVLVPLAKELAKRTGPLLRAAGATVREDALHDAAVGAYMSYVKRPEQYVPAKAPGGLLPYLAMSAHGDLLNALPGIERHRRVVPLSLVELRGADRNTPLSLVGGAGSTRGDTEHNNVAARHVPDAHLALMETEAERDVLRHMVAGERRTAVFATDLGLTSRPLDEQRREVKRAKDRIKKRLGRAGLLAGDARG